MMSGDPPDSGSMLLFRIAGREQVRPLRAKCRPVFVGPLLIRSFQRRLTRFMVTNPPHVAAFVIHLLESVLNIKRHIRVALGERNPYPGKSLTQPPPVQPEAITLRPAI